MTVKKEPTGAWYASFCISTDDPAKPAPKDIDSEDTVGLDLGILTFVHDSSGRSIGRLDLSDDRDRLEREQRSLSRKHYESRNWEKQRRRVAEVGWRDFITILNHHGRKNGCHVVEVEPRGTTKECTECGVETEKPVWVREHSCPSCGFEVDRDWNAALNVKSRGLSKLGVVHSEDTLVETATAVDTHRVSARCVVETGSPCLKEAANAAG